MERLDSVLEYDNLSIYQNSNYFSFSLESSLLANYSTIRMRDKKIVDFCTGNGIVPLILSKRTKSKIYGVEIQKKLVELAKKSVIYNNLDKQIEIILDDVLKFSKEHLNEFDLVLCNPPYFKVEDKSTFNESYEKMIARHEVFIKLCDICSCAKMVLKDHGSLCLVHRSDRLMEILEELRNNNLEPKRIKFIHENINKSSFLVLIEAQKCGKVGLKVDKPLIQYDEKGKETCEYQQLQKEVLK